MAGSLVGGTVINPDDYWVNNPRITPINKALLYDNAIWMAKMDMKDDIIDLINEFIDNCDLPEVEDRFEWLKDSINEKFSGYQE